ncbi:hypothetical protein ASD99_25850 [Mesorhizobium sp. Root695]|uniref:hypothetical protein n=1 Tax=Mesorhizobium sp. Root695 TaxID=1736589 RepID=UPI00071051F8|nr:hypothetical protein [Mesorhizobium sp. Root695]KRB29000.1 hypothetical protein ASD99_25850 [Mesorhizobium sp. Root695]
MIFYVCHRSHANTLASLLLYFRADLQDFVRFVPHDEGRHLLGIPKGTVIWTDLDRLSEAEIEASAILSERMKSQQPDLFQLNHPRQSVQRFELLRMLFSDGTNDFNAYRPELLPEGIRFPVFLRDEAGATYKTPRLLPSRAELDQELSNLGKMNFVRPMVVEFGSKPAPDGSYRKYASYRIGARSYSQHCFASEEWFIKDPGKGMSGQQLAEHAAYVRDNPHAGELSPIFEKARISYGRIDYTIVDGRIQVFEINTNPTVLNYPPTPFDTYDSQPYADMHAEALVLLPYANDPTSSPDIDKTHLQILGRLRNKYRRKRVKLTVRKGFRYFWGVTLGAK